VISDRSSGEPMEVMVARKYEAASGAICRQFSTARATGGPKRYRLACSAGAGQWRTLPLVTTPDTLLVRAR
jgi:hypothetical protein